MKNNKETKIVQNKEIIHPNKGTIMPIKGNKIPKAIIKGRNGAIAMFEKIETNEIELNEFIKTGTTKNCADSVIVIISLKKLHLSLKN